MVTVNWTQGTDNVTAQGDLVYNIYMSTTSGQYNYASPYSTTDAGVSSKDLSMGDLRGTHYFVVRCKDAAANEDTNTAEVSVPLSNVVEFSARLGLRVR